MSVRFGACVASARLQARLGSPMPTKATSRSRSSVAAAQIIAAFSAAPAAPVRFRFSAGALVAIVDATAHSFFRLEPIRDVRVLREVFVSVAHAEDILVEISFEPIRIL